MQVGASWDDTNRNSSELSPIFRIERLKTYDKSSFSKTYLGYSETSQVVGYSAIGGSETGGLFRSNHSLDRETSKTIELGHFIDSKEWTIDSCFFYRWDDDLTDWTYFVGDVNRTANPVDIETLGFELIASRKWKTFETIASYTYLKKKEDYKKIINLFDALKFPKNTSNKYLDLKKFILSDKKVKGGNINLILLKGIGVSFQTQKFNFENFKKSFS